MSSTKLKLGIIFLTLVWGVQFFFIKIGQERLSPFFTASLRFLIVFLVCQFFCWKKSLHFGLSKNKSTKRIVFNISKALNVALIYFAQGYLASAVTGSLSLTTPFFTTVFAHMYFANDKLNWRKSLALILGAVGVLVMIWGDSDQTNAQNIILIAFIAMIASQVFISLNQIMAKDLLENTHSMVLLRDLGLAAFIINLIVWLIEGDLVFWNVATLQDYAVIIYLALISTVYATFLYLEILKEVTVSKLSYLIFATAVVAVVVGVTINQEQLSLYTYIGIGSVLIGFLALRRA